MPTYSFITREEKGSKLTIEEMDSNLLYLQDLAIKGGPTGSAGPRGNDGNQGPQGVRGPIGQAGPQGTQGRQGPRGAQGAIGNVGAQGSIGANGERGYQGPQGTSGTNGLRGLQGPQGAQGDQGTTGAQGATGPQGIQGATGSQGAQGARGVQGTRGTQGYQGNQGSLGPVTAAGLNWKGLWQETYTYSINDTVGWASASWFNYHGNVGPTTSSPDIDNTNWALLAAQGAAGQQGPQGPIGSYGPLLSVKLDSSYPSINIADTVKFDIIDIDTCSGYNPVSGHYKPNVAGWYRVTVCIDIQGSGYNAVLYIYKGSSMVSETHCYITGSNQTLITTKLIYLDGVSSYDYIFAYIEQDSGSSKYIYPFYYATYMEVEYLRS